MPFGIVGRTGPGMRQVVRFGNRSTGRGTFGCAFGARHCIQWGLYGVRVRQRRDAALFSNYFGQTPYHINLHKSAPSAASSSRPYYSTVKLHLLCWTDFSDSVTVFFRISYGEHFCFSLLISFIFVVIDIDAIN